MLVTRNSNCVDDSRAKQQGDQHGDSSSSDGEAGKMPIK
jgi:hypothetical protein